jgi:Skp family chaperone for outer membrane proteins
VKRITFALAAVATLGVSSIGGSLRADPPQGSNPVQQVNSTAPATSARTRIAMINLSQVLSKYEKWQNYERAYKDWIEKMRVEFENKKKPGLEMEAQLAKMPAEDVKGREEIQQKLRDLKRQLQDYEEAAKKNLTKWQDDALVLVYREIHDAVESYARANDIEMVLHFNDAINASDLYHPMNVERKMKAPGCTVMYVTPGMDITDIIAANLNTRLHAAAPAAGGQQRQ